MAFSLRAQDVDVFESCRAIDPQILQVAPEKSKALADQEERDQHQHDNRDECIAAEKEPDQILQRPSFPVRRFPPRRRMAGGVSEKIHRVWRIRSAKHRFNSFSVTIV